MNFALLAVGILCLWGIRPVRDEDPLHPKQTGAINGIFALLVFLTHGIGYLSAAPADSVYLPFRAWMGQLVVVPFLFYSGYGIHCSIMKKGKPYVASLLRSRLPKVWYHFALAVLLYALLELSMGRSYPPYLYLLSLTGWESLGNSNWYIFCTLCLYLLTWIAFSLFPEKPRAARGTLLLLTMGYILLMQRLKDSWWYDTALAYPAGMIFAAWKPRLQTWLGKSPLRKLGMLAFWAGATFACERFRWYLWGGQAIAVCFALGLVSLTFLVRIGNPVLAWFGKYTFEIYILQRLPMILLQGRIPNRCLYLALCFAVTCLLAAAFRHLTDRLDRLIFERTPRRNSL